jgi:hypothetical protein
MATFELQEGDIVNALEAHRRKHKGWQLFHLFNSILFVAAGIFLLSPLCPTRQLGLLGWIFIGAGTLIGFSNAALPSLLAPRQARRLLLRNKLMRGERTCTWTDDAITTRTQYGVNTIPWIDFQSRVEGKGVFLLYSSPRQFICIPKRALTEAEVADFRRTLSKTQHDVTADGA